MTIQQRSGLTLFAIAAAILLNGQPAGAGAHRFQRLDDTLDSVRYASDRLAYASHPMLRDAYAHLKAAERLIRKAKKRRHPHHRHQRAEPAALLHFYQDSHRPRNLRTDLTDITHSRSFRRLVVDVAVKGRYPIILNTVKVKARGRWRPHHYGTRLQPGRNVLSIDVPRGAREMTLSFDHGRGSVVDVYLQ
jgi:hypothetical protein